MDLLLVWPLLLTTIVASPQSITSYHEDTISCGVNPPTSLAETLLRPPLIESLPDLPNGLIVNVHLTTVSQDDKTKVPRAIIDKQMNVINDAFAPHNISFKLLKHSPVVSADFSQPKGNDIYGKIVPALHSGNWETLNLVFLPNVQRNNAFLGVCNFPNIYGNSPLKQDGCVIDLDTLPGLYKPGADQQNRGVHPAKMFGKSAVHEIGHWFGLMHVFFPDNAYTCDDPHGDWVDDTPVQKGPSWGCPAKGSRDSCPGKEGLDAVSNYMDYVADQWSVLRSSMLCRG